MPVARLRAHGLVLELGARELALTRAEAAAVLRAAGHAVDGAALSTLMRCTEGWPAGIALAARHLDQRRTLERFEGGRLVVDYVREEVLRALPPDLLRFTVETSVSETLTVESCDALLDASGPVRSLPRSRAPA